MNSVTVPGPPINIPGPPQPIAIPAPPNFNGQWSGPLYGTTQGWGVLELDMDDGMITGTAYLYPSDLNIVPAAIKLRFTPKLGAHSFFQVPVMAFAPELGQMITRTQIPDHFPRSDVPDTANASITFNDDGSVFLRFDTQVTNGFGRLERAHSKPSGIAKIPMSWKDYKKHIDEWHSPEHYIFRGQSDSDWRLRTSFHRSSKKNLEQYASAFIPEAYKALVNKIGTKLDLNNPVDLGSFYSILQHHGYPTPLLDWTTSPWVAAYFAFESAKLRVDKSVRIFSFQKNAWQKLSQQSHLTMTRPHVSLVDFLPRENERAAPQESAFTITNVDDIEAFVVATEQNTNTSYLWAFDIPAIERDQALRDLDRMGFNRSRLFPDRDGICRAMRIKHFGVD